MKTHNFTPKQSEKILNLVDVLLSRDDHFYPFAKHVNELFTDKIGSTGETNNPTVEVIVLTPGYISELTSFNMFLSDFFFSLEDILTES